MKAERKFDREHPNALRYNFEAYGYKLRLPLMAVNRGVDNVQIWLPGKVPDVPQTGLSSLFALAGDCEVTCIYRLNNLEAPKTGYGAGLGLAFETAKQTARGSIQRVHRLPDEKGYVFQTKLMGPDGKPKEEYRFVASSAKWGRIGMRRTQKELIFLTSDDLNAPLQEIEHLPFTDQTIRNVTIFGDPGGSPTAVDVLFWDINVRAEQITGGVAEKDKSKPGAWWPWLVVPAAGGVLFWFWRKGRRKSDEAE